MIFRPNSPSLIVGRREVGKSTVARIEVEELMTANQRVVILSPNDNWWGLRLNRAGNAPSGFVPVIFGGDHADVPLNAGWGTALAHIATNNEAPMIICTGDLAPVERARFFNDFAFMLLRRPKWIEPLWLIVDDCEAFFVSAMADMMTDLLVNSRNRGLTVIAATSAVAKVSPYFSSCAGVVVMRMAEPADRALVEQWMPGTEWPEAVPRLRIGEGIAINRYDGTAETVKFPCPITYDSSFPGPVPPKIDVRPILGMLAEMCIQLPPEHEALLARIARLEHQLLAPGAEAAAIRVDAERRAARLGFDLCRDAAVKHLAGAGVSLAGFNVALDTAIDRLPTILVDDTPEKVTEETIRRRARREDVRIDGMTDNEWRVLAAVMQFPGSSWRDIAVVSQLDPTGGSFAAAVGLLRRRQMLRNGRQLIPTEDGIAAFTDDRALCPTGPDLIESWSQRVSVHARAIMHTMLSAHMYGGMTDNQIVAAHGGQIKFQEVRAAVAEMKALGLVVTEAGRHRLADVLFRR